MNVLESIRKRKCGWMGGKPSIKNTLMSKGRENDIQRYTVYRCTDGPLYFPNASAILSALIPGFSVAFLHRLILRVSSSLF